MPTTDSAWPDGTPCWIDYSAPDVDAARAFYSDVLGWTYSGGSEKFGGYDTALTGGRQAAGIYPRMDDSQPPRWITYFASSDAAAAARISGAGGTIIAPPMQVGPMGTMCIALGVQGEAFGVWQAAEHTGVQIFNEPGSLVWNEAAVEEPDAARAFYAAVFGFAYDEIPESGGYTTFRTTGRELGGLGGLQPGAPRGWTTCFSVSSADVAVTAVEAGGGKILTPPVDMPFGRYAVIEDPWGAPFSVMQEPTG